MSSRKGSKEEVEEKMEKFLYFICEDLFVYFRIVFWFLENRVGEENRDSIVRVSLVLVREIFKMRYFVFRSEIGFFFSIVYFF